MISPNGPSEQNEKLKSFLLSAITGIQDKIAKLKNAKIRNDDFKSLKIALDETGVLSQSVDKDDFSFLEEELTSIRGLTNQVSESDFNFLDDTEEGQPSLKKETAGLLSSLMKEIAHLKEIVGRLAMKSFLLKEMVVIKSSLNDLKGKIKAEDFNSLQTEVDEKSESLAASDVRDSSQLFILRRETGMLRENVDSMAVKRSLWSRVPASVWIALVSALLIGYFLWLAILQWRGGNQGLIYDYPMTQTASALQAEAINAATMTPSAAPTPTP